MPNGLLQPREVSGAAGSSHLPGRPLVFPLCIYLRRPLACLPEPSGGVVWSAASLSPKSPPATSAHASASTRRCCSPGGSRCASLVLVGVVVDGWLGVPPVRTLGQRHGPGDLGSVRVTEVGSAGLAHAPDARAHRQPGPRPRRPGARARTPLGHHSHGHGPGLVGLRGGLASPGSIGWLGGARPRYLGLVRLALRSCVWCCGRPVPDGGTSWCIGGTGGR